MNAVIEEFAPGQPAPPPESEYPTPGAIIGQLQPREYPIDTPGFPAIMRDAANEVQSYVKSPLALVICNALGVASLATQGLAQVRTDKRLVSTLSLYMIMIAESGERKTYTEKFFLHGVDSWVASQLKLTEPKLHSYEADLKVWQQQQKGLESRIRKAADKGDIDTLKTAREEMKAVIESQPVKPPVPKLKYTDATHEALTGEKGLAGYPCGGILTSEGGSYFGGASFANDSVMSALAKYNDLWSGDTITIDRKGDGSVYLNNVALMQSIAVQPAVLEKFIDKVGVVARESGYLARALLAQPDSTQGYREFTYSPEDMPATDQFNNRIRELLELLPQHITEAGWLKRDMLTLSDEAMETWIKYYNSVEVAMRPGGWAEFIRPEAARSADNAVRIAAIFHILERGLDETEVSAAHMEAAGHVAMWHLHEAKRFLFGADMPEHFRQAQKMSPRIAAFCRKRKAEGTADWNHITPRQLLRDCKVTGVKDSKTLKPVIMELLEVHHLLDWCSDDNSRRSWVVVNPRLLEVAE